METGQMARLKQAFSLYQLAQQSGIMIPVNTPLLKILFKPVVKRAAHRVWIGRSRIVSNPTRGRFTHAEVDELLAKTWSHFDQLAPHIPEEPRFGNRMNVRLAALTLAAYETLIDADIDHDYATALIADMAWKIYTDWGRIPIFLARIRFRHPARRLKMAVQLFMRFPFSPPGYRFELAPSASGVDLTIHRCPVADYMRSHGAADLCVNTWCNLDFPLAEMWGGRLHRSQTLAGGAPFCDFRFEVPDYEERR